MYCKRLLLKSPSLALPAGLRQQGPVSDERTAQGPSGTACRPVHTAGQKSFFFNQCDQQSLVLQSCRCHALTKASRAVAFLYCRAPIPLGAEMVELFLAHRSRLSSSSDKAMQLFCTGSLHRERADAVPASSPLALLLLVVSLALTSCS